MEYHLNEEGLGSLNICRHERCAFQHFSSLDEAAQYIEERLLNLAAFRKRVLEIRDTRELIDNAIHRNFNLEICYTNSKGETTVREIRPLRYELSSTELLLAIDVAADAPKKFKITSIESASALEV